MRAVLSSAVAMLLGACTSSQVQPLLPPQPIICVIGPDCDAKWARAAAWIKANSTLKIETQTATVIQTADPARSEAAPAFTVTKVARGEGRYEITFNGGCGSLLRCVPGIPESRARFTAFVLGEEPQLSSQ
jgi:hypothetical protein